jgi:choline dehydrogenase
MTLNHKANTHIRPGLTGLTVASRLTEDSSISVLVIESGQDAHDDRRVNDVRTYGQAFHTELDHNLTSAPVYWQNGKQLELVAGNMLGGSGSLNGASWTKGAKSQYDLLPLLTGDDSWGWESFNKYMLRAEDFHKPTEDQEKVGAKYEPAYHGEGGPVEVSFPPGIFKTGQHEALMASMKVWEGMEIDADAADGDPRGATIIPNMVGDNEKQHRSSPFTAYAEKQVQERGNFHILTGQRVTEIQWKEGEEVVAEGVHFQGCPNCELYSVKAEKEVLLAAGSLQSPQILELSGVGDRQVLEKAGVKVKMELNGVGKHMQEQTKNTIVHDAKSFQYDGTGPPSAIVYPDTEQIFKDNTSATYDYVMSTLPDYAKDLDSRGLVTSSEATLTILKAQVNNLFKDKSPAAEIFFAMLPGKTGIGIDLWNLIVLSRGTAHIHSNNCWDRKCSPSLIQHPFQLPNSSA